jgi:4-hydroxybenzoate polyprenyltransferase
VITTIGFAGLGYVTNDLSDFKKDALAGKQNSVAQIGRLKIYAILALFIILAIAPWFYLPVDGLSLTLIVVELILFVVYAFPPFRFKEKGILGIITDALYAHVVPGVLASWTFYLVGGKNYKYLLLFMVLLIIWQFFSGVRNIFYHQIKDFDNDVKSGVKTLVTKLGIERAEWWVWKRLIPLEIAGFIFFVNLLAVDIEFLKVGVALIWLYAAYLMLKKNQAVSEEKKYKRFTNLLLDDVYIQWIPFFILVAMIASPMNVRYIFVLHLLLFRNPVKLAINWIQNSRLVRYFSRLSEIKKGVVHFTLFVLIYCMLLICIRWAVHYLFTLEV